MDLPAEQGGTGRRRPGAPIRQAPRRSPDERRAVEEDSAPEERRNGRPVRNDGRGGDPERKPARRRAGGPPQEPEARGRGRQRPATDDGQRGAPEPGVGQDGRRQRRDRAPSEERGRRGASEPGFAPEPRRSPEQRPAQRRRAPEQRRGPVESPSGQMAARNGAGDANGAARAVRRGARRPEEELEEPIAMRSGSPDTAEPPTEALVDPGRHRRRAGESTEARPASAYRELAASDGRKARTGRRRRSSFWKELPLLIVVALVLTFLIQTFIAKVYVIPSGSMETTLHGCTGCNNDRVLVDKITYRFSDPQPGDVVVFRGPDSWSSEVEVDPPSNAIVAGLQQVGSLIGLAPPDEKDFVKRVIAVGGQTVQCCSTNGSVMVDNKPLNEPYIYYYPPAGPPKQQPFGPVTIPQGELWMMGDSRNNSADSRVADHGPVPVANVIGKARVIVLPFPRFGWIPAYDPQAAAVGMGSGGAEQSVPYALGLLVLPLAWSRRRLALKQSEHDDFLPPAR